MIGQVGGVAISSAIFQSNLETQLRRQIHTPDSEDVSAKCEINMPSHLANTFPLAYQEN